MRSITQAIIHCSATYARMNWGAEEIRRVHVEENGWSDIGYNYIIKRDGELANGRDLDGDGDVEEEIGAHARGFNGHSIGICLIGGLSISNQPEFNFTRVQMRSLESLVDDLKVRYPGIEIIGHRDVSNKSCPSFEVRAYFQ